MAHDDPFWGEEWDAYADHVLNEMLPKLKDSAYVMQLVPEDGRGDVKFWVELGASIMLDKPVMAVVFERAEVPEKLKLVADLIVRVPDGASPKRMAQIITHGLERMQADVEASDETG